MGKVQIITDSMTDVPKHISEKYDIIVVPLTVRFGEDEYRDGVDLTYEEFYGKLSGVSELPKTSQVTPATFVEVFKKALEEGKEVICINGSSRASGTHQSALIAKNELENDLIDVVDTLGLSIGAGLTVYQAAKMASEGMSRKEIVQHIMNTKEKVDHIFTVDTMDYLKMGGRLNPLKATIATLLNVKPILTVVDGLVEPLDKVRGSKKVMGKMIEIAKERAANFDIVAIAHANAPEAAESFKERIQNELNSKEIIVAEIGCTIGTHCGPGTLAIFYYK